MGSILELPESSILNKKADDQALVDVLQTLVDPAVTERNVWQVGWWITRAYFQGMRDFHVSDLEEGEVFIGYEDEEGEMHLKWEESLTRLATEVGRLAQLDLNPNCSKQLNSLQSLRNASLSQVLLDAIGNFSDKDLLDIQFLTGVCMYGTYGIADWTDQESMLPLKQVTELIPPWELLFIPAGLSCPTDLRIKTRSRLVPYRELEKITGWRPPDEDAMLDIVEMSPGVIAGGDTRYPLGSTMPDAGPMTDLYDHSTSEMQAESKRRRKKDIVKPVGRDEQYVIFREHYVLAPGGMVARYIAQAGRHIGIDMDHRRESRKVPDPIGVARYQDVGLAYGRSFSSKLIPFAMEMEKLLQQFLQDLADMDRFGYVLTPMGMGVNKNDFQNRAPGPKPVPYEIDYTQDVRGMFMPLQPSNPSDLPGRGLQLGMDLEDRLTAQGPMFGGIAPGRMDSAEGLDVLRSEGSTHLTLAALSVRGAYATYYRSALYNIGLAIQRNPTLIEEGLDIVRIDNSLAGIRIDPQTGRVMLSAEDVPDCWSVKIGIVSDDPAQKERRRQEALMMADSGRLSPLDFHLMNYKENWQFPVGDVATWENYVKAVLINLLMFGDGETPGQVPGAGPADMGELFNESFDLPWVHLKAIEEFVRPAQFLLASKQVRDLFTQRYQYIQSKAGVGRLPEQAPTLDMAAQQGAVMGRA